MSFGKLRFTKQGINLQAKAQSGIMLRFTKIAVGDGELSSQSVGDLTNLIHSVTNLQINKLAALTEGKAIVGGVLSNVSLSTGFYFREIGVFALDPDLGEILYCYGNAGALAEYIPPLTGELVNKQLDIVTVVGEANLNVILDQSIIYATQEDLNRLIKITVSGTSPDPAKANDLWLKIL